MIESKISDLIELKEAITKVAITGESINGVLTLDSPEKGKISQGAQGILWKGIILLFV